MRLLITILTLTFFSKAFGQTIPFDKYTVDTFHLGQFFAKKIVAYEYNTVTFFVDYRDYLKMHTIFWKRYKEGMKSSKKEKEKGEYINPDYEPRWLLIDSVYKVLKLQVRLKDTIFLTQKIFDKVGLGPGNNFFADLIEKNKCAIIDKERKRQFLIIRQKGSWYRGHLDAWGGRRYFLPGVRDFFIDATDWIS